MSYLTIVLGRVTSWMTIFITRAYHILRNDQEQRLSFNMFFKYFQCDERGILKLKFFFVKELIPIPSSY
uniref:Putative secreted protein n=1 Tax=Anopheles darlingi TaxID=43151 RepID=A0A2M4D8M0_ANODA